MESGHSPMVSRPWEVAMWIRRCAGEGMRERGERARL